MAGMALGDARLGTPSDAHVERIAKEAARKNSTKTAGPVGRAVMGAAIKVFAQLSNPEKADWMLHYKIDWDAPATAAGPRVDSVAAHS